MIKKKILKKVLFSTKSEANKLKIEIFILSFNTKYIFYLYHRLKYITSIALHETRVKFYSQT